ncbi:MAG TPA: hypothetical protein VLE02_01120 [Nitrosarchaeum sp.]|nr:hypothetical protein [Nitrosarchaeum sp.]
MASKYTEKYITECVTGKKFELVQILLPIKGRATRIIWKCICGCEYETQVRIVEDRKENNCKVCKNQKETKKETRSNNKYWEEQKTERWELIQKTFEDANCKLITTVDTYKNNTERLHYICYCGRKGYTSWKQFTQGTRCAAHTLERRIKTTQEIYGVDNVFQSKEIKDKCKATNKEKLGVEYNSQNKNVVAKAVATNKRNHGGTHNFGLDSIREQAIDGHIEKHGCKPGDAEFMKKKMMEKYGVEHCMQDPEIFQRAQKTGYKLKEHTLPSGKIVMIRGYEGVCIDYLILEKGIAEEKIVIDNYEMPEVWYIIPGETKKRRYHPDIYIPSKKLLIEVKSVYTFENDKERNLAKWNAVCQECSDHKFRTYIYKNKKELAQKWFYKTKGPIFVHEY